MHPVQRRRWVLSSSWRRAAWTYGYRHLRAAYPFVVLSSLAWSFTPADVHLSPRLAFAVSTMIGTVAGAIWARRVPRDLGDRLTGCALYVTGSGVVCLIPMVTATFSVMGPACQLGLLAGVVLATRNGPPA